MQLTPQVKRNISWMIVIVVLCFLFFVLQPVLTPFIVALVLAYALTPLIDSLVRLGRGKCPRILAVVLIEVTFILALFSLLLMVIPIINKELPLMREQVPLLFDRLNMGLQPVLKQWDIHLELDLAGMKTLLLNYLNTANTDEMLTSLLSSLKLGGSVALAVIGNAILIPVALFYLLMDWNGFVKRFLELIPPRFRSSYDSFVNDADLVLGQYLRGQLLVMLSLAIFYSVGLSLFGLDLALPIGIFTGLAVFVPYLGFGLGLVLALLAGLLQFASLKALVMVAVVFGLGQLIESFFLTPRLVGERIGLHPLAVIFALLAFGQLLGFVGILIALPSSAVLLVGIQRLRSSYLSSRLYLG